MNTFPARPFPHRHLLGIDGLKASDIDLVLDLAEGYVEQNRQDDKKRSLLRGRTIVNLFFENSTRTRTSFELAGKRLGADVINMSVDGTSVKKGETLLDTATTLNAMHLDALVVRHQESGAVQLLAEKVNCAVINGGDGTHEHPTQALLDALTIRRRKGKLGGLTVAICRRHPAQAGSRARTSRCSTSWAPGSASWRRVRCCRPISSGSASKCSTTCRAAWPMSTSS